MLTPELCIHVYVCTTINVVFTNPIFYHPPLKYLHPLIYIYGSSMDKSYIVSYYHYEVIFHL